jgi:hypothetical protein
MHAPFVLQFLQILLRQSEHNRDRPHLSDDYDARLIGRMDDISKIDLPDARAPIDRRFDIAII